MITPAFGLTATERVLPNLALDFTTASLDPRITFTRTTGASNPATYIDSSGVITSATNNQPRFDYDPVTLVCKGLLIEESRTNSLLNTDLLSTQIVTVTAAVRTLSFYGTGSVTLSGAHTAVVSGTGAYPTRTTYSFTPTAGALTLTVAGTVQYAQLEAGAFATSYIPTTTTALTRNADVATMTGTNFSDWYNASEGTFNIWNSYSPNSSGNAGNRIALRVWDGTTGNQMTLYNRTGTANGAVGLTGGAVQFVNDGVASTGNNIKSSFAYSANNINLNTNGSPVFSDLSATIPVVNQFDIGPNLGGHVQKIFYFPYALTAAQRNAFSK